MSGWRGIASGLALMVVVVLLAGGLYVQHFLQAPLDVPEQGIAFEIPPGTPFAHVCDELDEAGIVSNGELLCLYARWTDQAGNIQAGEYQIESGTTPRRLLQQFTSGDVRLYSFTIVEGWNHRELLQALQAHPEVAATLSAEDWPVLLDELGADATWPEGLFLPETYRFPRGTSDRAILKQAYELMQDTLAEEWATRSAQAPVSTPYEALILASIVEKETARADERQRIAGVFARRLEKRMRLQTDPTVIYGIGPTFNGNLTRRDLQTDTPYNTYTRHGLPPTPIAMPGRAAIHAALNPADGDALYFVATGLGDGSHAFSATKEEHDRAVRDYLTRLRQQRNRSGQ
ncbi:MAG: endolytic transglycosylase MltG [Woeseiaceae bacterium]|nr:endolytic transglycosylase MltG [Woeseiaceae bacterium]